MAVRPMGVGDIAGTVSLFQDMQAHYRVACPPREDIEAKLAHLPAGVVCLVAADPAIVGFAVVGTIFPGPGLNPGLFLKELFVSADARGRGIGTELMRSVARFAVERGFARVDWTADRGDRRLLRFYGTVGATEQSEKTFLRLTGQALADFAGLRHVENDVSGST